MNDMSTTIVAKSDQINAADLLGETFTGIIREVNIKASADDQPVSIFFEGERKAFRPCKGVRRLLVKAWGLDANNYIGHALTLFCDPTVTWAGKEEGGIRVSHMSHIDGDFIFAMRTSRAATKPYQIRLLRQDQRQQSVSSAKPTAKQWTDQHLAAIDNCAGMEALDALIDAAADDLTRLSNAKPDFAAKVTHAYQLRSEALAREVKPDADAGEGYADD